MIEAVRPNLLQQKNTFLIGNNNRMKFKLINNEGFTLFETLVVIFVFALIMLLMGGVFAFSINVQRKATNLQQAEENAGFTLETMAKEIRVSQIVGPDNNCPASPAATLTINHPINGNIVYSLSGNAIHRNVGGTDTIISSNTVQFTRLQFCVSGTTVDDRKQPRVTILASLKSVKANQQAAIDIQTTLSQRFLGD